MLRLLLGQNHHAGVTSPVAPASAPEQPPQPEQDVEAARSGSAGRAVAGVAVDGAGAAAQQDDKAAPCLTITVVDNDASSSVPRATSSVSLGLSSSASTASLPDADATCRICLSPRDPELGELVRPCACAGSVGAAHVECLKAWAGETGSLRCEICKKTYAAALRPQLEPHAQAARAARAAAAAGAEQAAAAAAEAAAAAAATFEAAAASPPPPPPAWQRALLRVADVVLLAAVAAAIVLPLALPNATLHVLGSSANIAWKVAIVAAAVIGIARSLGPMHRCYLRLMPAYLR